MTAICLSSKERMPRMASLFRLDMADSYDRFLRKAFCLVMFVGRQGKERRGQQTDEVIVWVSPPESTRSDSKERATAMSRVMSHKSDIVTFVTCRVLPRVTLTVQISAGGEVYNFIKLQ